MADKPREIHIVDEDWFNPAKPEDVRKVINELIDGTGVTQELKDLIAGLDDRVTKIEKVLDDSGIRKLTLYIVDGVLNVDYDDGA